VIHDLSLNGLNVVTEIRLHELPHLLSSLLIIIVLELRLFQKMVKFLRLYLPYIGLGCCHLAGQIWTPFC
jgi:hypothetical protein